MSGAGPVLLDACVLVPGLLRRVIEEAAAAGLLDPRVSPRVLEEWRLAAARREGSEGAEAAHAAARAFCARFPRALVPDPPAQDLPALPDPADAHVVAAARACGAAIILTLNLRDFPARALAPLGLAARHPDGVLWELWSHHPSAMAAALAAALPGRSPAERRGPLKRARLPRLGKAQAGV